MGETRQVKMAVLGLAFRERMNINKEGRGEPCVQQSAWDSWEGWYLGTGIWGSCCGPFQEGKPGPGNVPKTQGVSPPLLLFTGLAEP